MSVAPTDMICLLSRPAEIDVRVDLKVRVLGKSYSAKAHTVRNRLGTCLVYVDQAIIMPSVCYFGQS